MMTTTRNHLKFLKKTMVCLQAVLDHRPDTVLVIIDNASEPDVVDYLKTLSSPQIEVNLLATNNGRAVAHNSYLQQAVRPDDQPAVIFSVDPDITFSVEDFDRLIDAVTNLKRIGMLSMRYVNNACNPESRLNRPPRILRGKSGKQYAVSVPSFSNVAGGIFAIRGDIVMKRLKGRLFPKKSFALYINDDGALHDALRRRFYVNGYLEGTSAKHYKSGNIILNDEE